MSDTHFFRPRPGGFFSLLARPAGWVFLLALAAVSCGALYLQWRKMRTYRETPWQEAFFLPRPEYVERLALGYNAWSADFLFLRAIQAFGARFYGLGAPEETLDAIYNFFDVISTLDPHFLDAYKFGNLVMGDEGGRQDMALAYLEKGQRANWRHHVPWYEASYIKIWGLKEFDNQARYYVRQATKCPDAPTWMERWGHYIEQESGNFKVALLRWAQTYALSAEGLDDLSPKLAVMKIRTVAQEWHRKILQDACDAFFKDRGTPPKDLRQLNEDGYLPPIEVVDVERLLADLELLANAGQKVSDFVGELVDNAMIMRPGPLPCIDPPGCEFVLGRDPGVEGAVVHTMAELESLTMQELEVLRGEIDSYYKEYGYFPLTVDGLQAKSMGWEISIPEPYGVGWDYNSFTGRLNSPIHPDF